MKLCPSLVSRQDDLTRDGQHGGYATQSEAFAEHFLIKHLSVKIQTTGDLERREESIPWSTEVTN
jgi:hypothetical protein